MGIFIKKTQEEKNKEKRERLLAGWILECRKEGFKNEVILKKLLTINVEMGFLLKHFNPVLVEIVLAQIKSTQEVKQMPKQKERDYEEDEEEIEEEQYPEDSDEEQDEDKKKPIKREQQKKDEVTVADILKNHEERIRNLESAIYRIKAI